MTNDEKVVKESVKVNIKGKYGDFVMFSRKSKEINLPPFFAKIAQEPTAYNVDTQVSK